MKYISIILIVFLVLYEKLWRSKVCKRKIYQHINNIGGEVNEITKLSLRDELYQVTFTVNGKPEQTTVKFDILYRSTWE